MVETTGPCVLYVTVPPSITIYFDSRRLKAEDVFQTGYVVASVWL